LGINIGKNKDTPTEDLQVIMFFVASSLSLCRLCTINVSSPNTANCGDLQQASQLTELLTTRKTSIIFIT